MASNPIDNLKIVISTDVKNTTQELSNIAQAMKEIRKASLSSFKGLNRLGDALKYLGTCAKYINMERFERLCNCLEKINGFRFNFNTKGFERMKKAQTGLSTFVDKSWTRGAETEAKFEGGYRRTAPPPIEYYGATESKRNNAIDLNDLIMGGQFELKIKNLTKKFNEFFKSIKRIAMYRLIRTALKQIGDAFTVGIKNMYAFSTRYSTQFSVSMNNITTSLVYMKNALGSMLSEVLIVLEPLLVSLADTVANIANRLAECMAHLRGADTFNKAIKYAQRYATVMGGLNLTLLKFDEINKLNGTNATAMFEVEDVDVENAKSIESLLAGIVGLLTIIDAFKFRYQMKDIIAMLGETSVEGTILGLLFKVTKLCGEITLAIAGISWADAHFQKMLDADTLWGKVKEALLSSLGTAVAVYMGYLAGGTYGAIIVMGIDIMVKLMDLYWSDDFQDSLTQKWNELFGSKSANPFNTINSVWSKDTDYDKSSMTFGEKVKTFFREKFGINIYANGGFPEDGMFFANHNELVGGFSNGKTAVANNEQITTGIREAVYDAIVSAGGMSGGDWTIELKTDGLTTSRTIISSAERANRRSGKTVIPVEGL